MYFSMHLKFMRFIFERIGIHFNVFDPERRLSLQYQSGAATSYVSRNQALKKLQLTLPDFRLVKQKEMSNQALCRVLITLPRINLSLIPTLGLSHRLGK